MGEFEVLCLHSVGVWEFGVCFDRGAEVSIA
jgi:hypothetical protein